MKKIEPSAFQLRVQKLDENTQAKINEFFADLNTQIILPPKQKLAMMTDFENAITYYLDQARPIEYALEMLNTSYLGGFYARPSVQWFALDDSAKIYPISLRHGVVSSFRLSVYLHAPVEPALLQMALTFTIKRFPSFATTLKKGFFWHYLDSTKGRCPVIEEKDRPFLPMDVSLSGSKSFKVLYFQNRISVEFFHVLTDGTGGMIFLKTLVREYFRLLGIDSTLSPGCFDINGVGDPGEDNNEYQAAPKTSASGFLNKASLQMSGNLARIKPCQILHFRIDSSRLKAVAKSYDATITGYISALMLIASKYATEASSGDISVQIPVNMRQFYPSTTIRNFTMYFGIRIPIKHITTVEHIMPEVKAQLAEKATKDKMMEMVFSTKRLVDSIRYLPLFIKTPVARFFHGKLGETAFTTTLSNLGVVSFPPELSQHISSLDFGLGTAALNRASVTLATFGNVTTLTITKITTDNGFEEKMLSLLNADQIPLTIEGSDVYEDIKHVSTEKKIRNRKKSRQ